MALRTIDTSLQSRSGGARVAYARDLSFLAPSEAKRRSACAIRRLGLNSIDSIWPARVRPLLLWVWAARQPFRPEFGTDTDFFHGSSFLRPSAFFGPPKPHTIRAFAVLPCLRSSFQTGYTAPRSAFVLFSSCRTTGNGCLCCCFFKTDVRLEQDSLGLP